MSAERRLRISGGTRRGLKILAPESIRPTSARLREALFNVWADRLRGSSFLDLFAGSGAVGLEAASRGAARVVLVEGDRGVLAALRGNRRLVDLASVTELQARLPEELERRLPAGRSFDLIFADPPYGFEEFGALLATVEPYLRSGGEIALEHRWREGAPVSSDRLVAVRSRRYGDSGLTLFCRPAGAPP